MTAANQEHAEGDQHPTRPVRGHRDEQLLHGPLRRNIAPTSTPTVVIDAWSN
jgi:hypothetical protein